MDESMLPGLDLARTSRSSVLESPSWTMQMYGSRKSAKEAKQARREEKRKAKMQQRNESIHKMVFERLDKEMRNIPLNLIQTVKVDKSDGLSKDIYPYSVGISKVIRKFDLPDKFFYAHVEDDNSWTVHFTVNREEDPETHVERKTSISVITVR